MIEHHRISALGDERGKLACDRDGAVPSAGAANGDHKLCLALLYVLRKREIDKVLQLVHEVLRRLILEHELVNVLIQSRLVPKLRDIIRIWQEAHVENEVSLQRNAVLEAEGQHIYRHCAFAQTARDHINKHSAQHSRGKPRGIEINLVITKDLSRLGRNYLQTGTLIEDFFPRHGVRYIAMNDGIDTMRENNDIAPFKNILNEMYSKDISKKVHSSYLLKAQQGQFTGCIAPFGYQKDPEDKNHLLVDEETAPIVRQIFRWALEGHGPNFIRRRLEEQKVPCPTWWNRERGFRNVRTKWEKKDPVNGRYMWDFSVIKDILMNPVYTGAIASQKKDYRFKIGTIGEKKPQDWIVVEERHEPIVDRKSFDIVQDKLKSRQRSRQTGEISLFAGLLKCGECGKSLTIRYTNDKHPKQIYSCKTYNAYGKQHCTQHRVEYETLYRLVLNKIRECAKAALMDGEAVAGRLTNTCEAEQKGQREALERSLTKHEERIEVLEKMVLRLYEDMVAGRISEANFNLMLDKTQKEQAELKERVEQGRRKLADEIRLAVDAKQWVDAIQEYADITELDAATLNRLIKEIVVHEHIDSDKTRHISIEIHFNLKPIPEVEQVTA